jgi:hypothetical protein
MIADAPAIDGSTQPKARVFISYSRKDEDFAQELLTELSLLGEKIE